MSNVACHGALCASLVCLSQLTGFAAHSAQSVTAPADQNSSLKKNMGTLSFGVRDCVAVPDSTEGEQACSDQWVFSAPVSLSLQNGGGSCTSLSAISDPLLSEVAPYLDPLLTPPTEHRASDGKRQPALACAYGVFQLPGSDAVYVPLVLLETDSTGKARLLLSLAQSENGMPGVVRSDVVLRSVDALWSLGEFSLRGKEMIREAERVRYPLFGLRF